MPPKVAPRAKPTDCKPMASARQRAFAYSLVSTLAFTILQPIPTPVKKRSMPKVHGPCAHSVATINAPAANKLPSTSGRRPQRSESGVKKTEPTVMPIIPADSSQPRVTFVNSQSLTTADAVKAMTKTSMPSIALIKKHKAMARHCRLPIEAASKRWRSVRSELMVEFMVGHTTGLRPESRPILRGLHQQLNAVWLLAQPH